MLGILERLWLFVLVAIDAATTWCETLSRRTLAWGGVALAALLLLAVNSLAGAWFKTAKIDLTSDRLFTITDGTRKTLAGISEPIDVRLYFSKKLGEAAPAYARYFERVRSLLEQYRDISGGRLRLTVQEPEAFSDGEDRAVAAGLRGIRLNSEGEQGYFGLVATNSTDNQEVVPFFVADREKFIEYDLTKIVHALANPKKRAIGLISGVPLDGGMSPMMGMGGRPSPPWMIMEQIRDFFEVQSLGQDVAEIPAGLETLMIVAPDRLSAKAAFAIDQFALRGGKVLLFLDPLSEMGRPAPNPMMGGGGAGDTAELEKLLAAWGIGYDPKKVAADISMARRVQFGGRGGVVTEYVAWLGVDKRHLDQKDVLSSGIEKMAFASAGILTKRDGATTTVTPLLTTSPASMAIDAAKLGQEADPVALLRAFKPEGKPLWLAARVSGDVKSAFPGGAPPEPAKPDPAKPDAAKKPAEPAAAAKPALTSGRISAIVISDSDMLSDPLWVEVRDMLGQQMAMPTTHNATFVLAALENLSGSEALIGLRARGVNDRPFTHVENLRRDAERKFREKEQGLTEKLKTVQAELAKLETGQGGGQLVSDKERQAVEKFRGEMLSVRRELRDVKLALRKDIDRLDGWLKFANIALVPLAIALGGLGYAIWRRRRTAGVAA
jgi:ABC-type uncharacterized transport system involved in gliding motility auxiliary subunit